MRLDFTGTTKSSFYVTVPNIIIRNLII